MRLGRGAADLFTLKYQTKHFLYCEVSRKQDSEGKRSDSGFTFTGRREGGGGRNLFYNKVSELIIKGKQKV